MKTGITIALIALAFSLMGQRPEERTMESKVDSVTVFLQGAQIYRSGKLDIPLGRSIWVAKGLSPFIDPQSMQVKTNPELVLISVNHRLNYLEKIDQNAIQVELLALEDSMAIVNAYLQSLTEEEVLLKSNKDIKGAQTGLNPEDLKGVNEYYTGRIQAIKLQSLALMKKYRRFDERVRQLRSQLQQGGKDISKARGEIVFELECKRAQKANIALSYITGQASWFPLYDIRAKDVKSDIELVYRARVSQSTGEDWKQVQLTLSNGDPSASGSLPVLQPWYLSLNQYYSQPPVGYQQVSVPGASGAGNQVSGRVVDKASREPLIGATVMVEGSTIGTVTDLDGNFTLPVQPMGQQLTISYVGYQSAQIQAQPYLDIQLDQGALMLEEVVVAGAAGRVRMKGSRGQVANEYAADPISTVIENQTNVFFRVDLPYNLPSDGAVYTVDLASYFIPAYYEYHTVPKLDESAYLLARITEWDQYNLLEGETNLFFEDTYVGKTVLDVRFLKDTLDISLGKDRNLLIKRSKVTDYAKRRFIGTNTVESRSWKIEVRNNKAQAVNLVVHDQLPLSRQSEIEVTPGELSGAKADPEFGRLRWTLSLDPRTTKNWTWGYEVKYPKGRNLILE
jgi:hypothetical protein